MSLCKSRTEETVSDRGHRSPDSLLTLVFVANCMWLLLPHALLFSLQHGCPKSGPGAKFGPMTYFKWPSASFQNCSINGPLAPSNKTILKSNLSGFLYTYLSEGVKERIFYCILLSCTSGNVSYLCFVQGTHLTKDYLH